MNGAMATGGMEVKKAVGRRRAMASAALKTAGVEQENMTIALAEWLMGVAINNAIGFGKAGEQAVFNIEARATMAMKDTNSPCLFSDRDMLWQASLGGGRATVAVDGIDGFGAKGLED